MSEAEGMVSPEEMALVVSQQVVEILEARGVGDEVATFKNLHEFFEANNGLVRLMQETMTVMIFQGLKKVFSAKPCKHLRDRRFCSKRCGLLTTEGAFLCAPCGLGNSVLRSAILGKPTCEGYEPKS